MSEPNPLELVQRLEAQLSPQALLALQTLRSLTDAASLDLYLVGGAVRDLLLQRPNLDLDLAIEADVAPIAEALASATGGRVVLHPHFGTSTISGPGFHLDLARTRRETYEHPGALPTVEPASLADDLKRRDFTINAIALNLSRSDVVDLHQGLHDIASGVIRVLHENSFQDDGTRMFRAARYAARLGFQIERQTIIWMERDLTSLDSVSGPRIRREFQLMFQESEAVDACLLAVRHGVFMVIYDELSLSEEIAARWRSSLIGEPAAPLDETGFCIVCKFMDNIDLDFFAGRLQLKGRFEDALRDAVRLRSESSKLAAMRHDPVSAVETLQHAAPSAVWATGIVAGGDVAATCDSYLREWRHVKPLLRGDDLLALGVQPGVAVGDTLRALRDARLTGSTTTREDEEALVRAMLQKPAP